MAGNVHQSAPHAVAAIGDVGIGQRVVCVAEGTQRKEEVLVAAVAGHDLLRLQTEALIEREVVNRGWLDKQDFMDLFAMTQSLPGIFAVNISIFVGYKLKKVTGSIVCAGGTILPSFCIILAIALFFNHFQDNIWVMKIFNGIRPAVVALILVPCISAARSLHLKWVELILPAIGAVLIWKCGVSPAYIVLAGIIGGLIYTFWIKGKMKQGNGE